MSHGSHSLYYNVHSSHANTGHINSTPHTNHGNHSNTVDPNTGLPINLTWNNWTSNPESGTPISGAINKIKELRDKLSYLQVNKGWKTKLVSGHLVPDNPTLDLSGVSDASFTVGIKIDDVQYDNLLDGLNSLNANIAGSSTTLPARDLGHNILKEDIINLKTKINDLALLDVSTQHSSHQSTGVYTDHVNHSLYTNHASYSDAHSSHVSHSNSCDCDNM